MLDEVSLKRNPARICKPVIATEIRDYRCSADQGHVTHGVYQPRPRRLESLLVIAEYCVSEAHQGIAMTYTQRNPTIDDAFQIRCLFFQFGTPPEHHAVRKRSVKTFVVSRYAGSKRLDLRAAQPIMQRIIKIEKTVEGQILRVAGGNHASGFLG